MRLAAYASFSLTTIKFAVSELGFGFLGLGFMGLLQSLGYRVSVAARHSRVGPGATDPKVSWAEGRVKHATWDINDVLDLSCVFFSHDL